MKQSFFSQLRNNSISDESRAIRKRSQYLVYVLWIKHADWLLFTFGSNALRLKSRLIISPLGHNLSLGWFTSQDSPSRLAFTYMVLITINIFLISNLDNISAKKIVIRMHTGYNNGML